MGTEDLNQETTMTFFNKLLRDEQGATAIEYGLIAALIAVAAITAMGSLGNQLSTIFILGLTMVLGGIALAAFAARR